MITTEDRARAAMQAIGDTVRDAPPLQLPSALDLPAAADEVQFGGHGAAPRQPAPPRAVRPVPAAAAGAAGGGPSWPRSPPRSRSRPSPSRW